jgi:hypothetical protein
VCMCVHVCACVCVCACVRACVRARVCVHVYTHLCTCIYGGISNNLPDRMSSPPRKKIILDGSNDVASGTTVT